MPRAAPMSPDDRRRAIVEAVLPLVVARGELPSTREIAEAAGIAEGTIYRAFDDKSALLHAVVERALTAPPAPSSAPSSAGAPAVPGTRPTDLHAQVVEMTRRILGQMRTVSVVLMALRRELSVAPGAEHRHDGPPAYVVEANQRLVDRLTALFEAHRDHLRVEPATAALVLRGVVVGSQHPGMSAATSAADLTPEQIADVVVHGVSACRDRRGCPC